MKKIIEIDILDRKELTEKYNNHKLSKELMNYIIDESSFIMKKDEIKIIINTKNNTDGEYIKIITEGLKEEYRKSLKIYHLTNIKQLCLLILGIIFLFLSTLVKEESIWNEILLIGGWVPIWETLEIELIGDLEGKRKRTILKKLLKSEIIEKQI